MTAKKNGTQEFKKHTAQAGRKDGDTTDKQHNEVNVDSSEEQSLTKLEEIENELQLSKDKALRIQAEFENYRKRTFKEITSAKLAGQIDALTPILQVFDHFNMAMLAAESAENMDAIRDGMKMILNEFDKAIGELGVEKIDASSATFDPNLHEAMANEPSSEVEEGKIIKQWSYGYKMGERLLRPASVVVSSGPGEE